MQIAESLTFNEYWNDDRFKRKRPRLIGSKKQAFGDNIYVRDGSGQWLQADSHHSFPGGIPNPSNIKNDTQTDRILIGTDYAYWGAKGPKIPQRFRNYQGNDICAGRNHKSNFPSSLVTEFLDWFRALGVSAFIGAPADWPRTP
jgi:hypothetical protein